MEPVAFPAKELCPSGACMLLSASFQASSTLKICLSGLPTAV